MKFEDIIQDNESKKNEVIAKLHNVYKFLDLYTSFKYSPKTAIRAINSDPLTNSIDIFREEIADAIKHDFTHQVAYAKGIEALGIKGRELLSEFKHSLALLNRLPVIKEVRGYNEALLNNIDITTLNSKKDFINTNVNKDVFLNKTRVLLSGICRGALVHGLELNEFFINLAILCKNLLTRESGVELYSAQFKNLLESASLLLKGEDKSVIYKSKFEPLVGQSDINKVFDTNIDNMVNLIRNAETNKKTNIKDTGEEVFYKFQDLVNVIILSFSKIRTDIQSNYDLAIVYYSNIFNLLTEANTDKIKEIETIFDNTTDTIKLETVNDRVEEIELNINALNAVNKYSLSTSYYHRSEIDVYNFIYKLVFKIAVDNTMDVSVVSNSKR